MTKPHVIDDRKITIAYELRKRALITARPACLINFYHAIVIAIFY